MQDCHLRQLDTRMMTSGGSDPAIAGEQRSVKHLSETHVHRIVGC